MVLLKNSCCSLYLISGCLYAAIVNNITLPILAKITKNTESGTNQSLILLGAGYETNKAKVA